MAKPRKAFHIGNKYFKIGDKVEILCWDCYKYVRKSGIITYVLPVEKKPTKKELINLYGEHIPEELLPTLSAASKRTRVKLQNPNDPNGHYVVPVIDEKFINRIDDIETDVDIPVNLNIGIPEEEIKE